MLTSKSMSIFINVDGFENCKGNEWILGLPMNEINNLFFDEQMKASDDTNADAHADDNLCAQAPRVGAAPRANAWS